MCSVFSFNLFSRLAIRLPDFYISNSLYSATAMSSYVFLFLTLSATQALFIAEPKVPYVTQLGQTLEPGTKITITGIILNTAYNIAFNLRQGLIADYGGNVPFHFNPRFFSPNYVVWNTHLAGAGWLTEERTMTPFPFQKGYPFIIEIMCGDDQFYVSVDGKPFYNYRYRVPLSTVDNLEITGTGQVEIFTIDVGNGAEASIDARAGAYAA